ncbi:MAG: isoprenylcysteine carboxylmethyltransferase family protein [Bacteroidetes bacterium]|nr:isoprenylcysteine carboxylmethyltransferase family protein [Bacteroidota bacterium]
MEKLNFFGVGPKIGRIVLPYLTMTIALTIIFPEKLTFGKTLQEPFLIAGIVLLAIALVLYFTTLRMMLPGIRNNRLVTGGAYRLCRNPLYMALLLFLIPGLSLVLNSWIMLSTSVVGYLVFRKFIHKEEELLEGIFGDEYRQYHEKTSQFFPNPF